MDDFERKVRERYGAAPFTYVEFSVPNEIEGGDGIGRAVYFENGKATAYLRVRGLWSESDVPELETYFAKETTIPAEVQNVIVAINGTKHEVLIGAAPSTPEEAEVALMSAAKHQDWVRDPTPPDITPDIIKEESWTASDAGQG